MALAASRVWQVLMGYEIKRTDLDTEGIERVELTRYRCNVPIKGKGKVKVH